MKKKLPTPQKLPSGAYRCQVMVDGKRVSVVDDNPDVAQAKAIALKNGIQKEEEEKKERKKSLKLCDAIDDFISIRENVLSPATIRGYDTIKRNRFKHLMEMNIYEITKEDVQKAVSEDAKKASGKTLKNAYGLVKTVLKQYKIDVSEVNLPQVVKSEKTYPQPDEIGKLIDVVKGDSCETEVLIAVWLGMRRSEIMGLHWDCIDFENNTIKVMRAVVPDKNNKWVEKDIPKNESSQRTVSCPDYIMKKLKEIRKPNSEGRIFKIHPDTLLKHIHKACKKAGIVDTSTHGLRHVNAAIMMSAGVPTHLAMKRGGWSSEETYRKTYSYIFKKDEEAADAQIDDYIKKLHTDLHTD